MQKLFSIVLMLVLLLLAFILDRWGLVLRELGAQAFQVSPRLWGGVLSDLVFMIAVLGFAWLVYARLGLDLLVWVIYILVGGFFLFYIPIWSIWLGNQAALPQSSILRQFNDTLMSAGLRSFFSLSSASILVAGIVGLLAGRGEEIEGGPRFG